MPTKLLCEELHKLNADAVAAFAEAKRIRRQRDVSFYEDAELSREGHRRIDALLKHLLIGHDGEPCPYGDRPIARSGESECVKQYIWGFLPTYGKEFFGLPIIFLSEIFAKIMSLLDSKDKALVHYAPWFKHEN